MRSALAELTQHLKSRAREDPVCRLLMTVPGVGPLVSSAYVATIDDPARFARTDQVPAYLGLVPSVSQSGETERRGRITKEGDHLLRWLLVEAAHVLLAHERSDHALKRWGKRLERRKGPAKAKVAVARKRHAPASDVAHPDAVTAPSGGLTRHASPRRTHYRGSVATGVFATVDP